MKAIWQEAIRLHMELAPSGSGVFRLREPYVGVSVVTTSARRRRTPFLFASGERRGDHDRISIDASNESILILRKRKTYLVGGRELSYVHRHCIPWSAIAEITFVERLPEQPGTTQAARA